MSAVSFLIEIGGDVRLFANDKKLIATAGLDPSTHQSGKYEGGSRISKRGNRHLRRLLWLMSKQVITNSPTFRSYFFKGRSEGLPYKMAVLAIAHKLVRVIFALLVHERPYEEGGIKCSWLKSVNHQPQQRCWISIQNKHHSCTTNTDFATHIFWP